MQKISTSEQKARVQAAFLAAAGSDRDACSAAAIKCNLGLSVVRKWAHQGGWIRLNVSTRLDAISLGEVPVKRQPDRAIGARKLAPLSSLEAFERELIGAFKMAGLNAGSDSAGVVTCCCPACTDEIAGRLAVTEGAVECPDCQWEASGESWEIAAAAKGARAGVKTVADKTTPGWFQTTRLCDGEADTDPEPLELIKGVMHEGEKTMLSGGSKSCKTWVVGDLAISLANGTPWLGFECTKCPVLIINFELKKKTLDKRLKAIIRAKHLTIIGHDRSKHDNLNWYNARGIVLDFKSFVEPLIAKIKELGAKVVFIDPVYSALGGRDENKAADVNELMNEFESICQATGVALVFVHHHAKGNSSEKSANDRASGSGVWARAPDNLITMTRPQSVKVKRGRDTVTEDPDHDMGVEFTFRDFPPIKPIKLHWRDSHFIRQRLEMHSEAAHAAAVTPSGQVARCLPIIAKMPETKQTGGVLCDCVRWVQSSCGQMSFDESKTVWEAARMMPDVVESLPDNWWRGVDSGQ